MINDVQVIGRGTDRHCSPSLRPGSIFRRSILTLMLAVIAMPSSALDFKLGDFGFSVVNRVVVGAAWRLEDPDPALIGKLNLNPGLCDGDDCLSLANDPAANQRLVDAPGAFFGHFSDDGNINYAQGDLVSALGKITTDLNVSWQDYNLKVRGIYFFDEINRNFDETHWNTNYQNATSRRDDEVESLIGDKLRLLDLVASGFFFLGERGVTLSVGQQKVRWGEANLIALNSLSEINPPDARQLHQVGVQINEVFQPVPLALISGDIFPDYNITGEAFYQLQWKPVIADPGGSFYGSIDPLYRSESDPNRYALVSLGQFSEDPLDQGNGRGEARFQHPLAALLTDTSFSIPLLPDDFGHPRDSGQYGLRLNWFADSVNNGTEFGFYYMRYHSRLPYVGFFAADRTPLRDGSGTAAEAVLGCTLAGNDCLPIDTMRAFLEYPEDIDMFGISFSTNVGKWSVAGEYSYRPNVPVQVSLADGVFASLQPALPAEDIVIGAQALGDLVGTLGASLPVPVINDLIEGLGGSVAGALDPVDQLLGLLLDETAIDGFPLTVPGARSAVPDFIETRYRGHAIGERNDNPYIAGYERMKVGQFAVTGIRIFGSSYWLSSLIKAEQIVNLLEFGFTHVVDMPSLAQLQFNGGTASGSPNQTHYSPGADGSGAGRHPDGADVDRGARSLNPHSQSEGFADSFSWGYRLVTFLEYNDVVWGLNLKPFLVWAHDVKGNAPSPMSNFLEGRKEWQVGTEIFMGQQWAMKLQYNGFAGTRHNPYRDRDVAVVEMSYTF